MIFSDTIIENSRIFLRNLVKSTSTEWSTPSGNYGFYQANYEIPLGINKNYYVGYKYKFTTTDQSPTWVQFYSQNGSTTWNAKINNPVAGTEYNKTSLAKPSKTPTITITYGTIYQGASNAIVGVKGQVKEVFVYDVTDLYKLLLAKGIVTNDTTMKTWCDNNLTYYASGENYEITEIVQEALDRVSMKQGQIVTDEFIETDGMDFYATSVLIRQHKYFDTGSALSIYNNSGGGTVTHTRVDAQTQGSPFYPQHKYVLQITTNGTASPGAGGFCCQHIAAANKIFIERFIAKIPEGYSVQAQWNSQGTGSTRTWLSSTKGTGKWEEYAILYRSGTEGSFSSGGYINLSGSNNTSVTWYVAYCINCEITECEYLKNFTVLGNVDRIKSGTIFSRQFDTMNLLPNGNGAKQEITMFSNPSWQYDTTDVAGNAKASFVQPVGIGAGCIGPWIPVNPAVRYKISYWVKCQQDMSSFLTAIRIKCGNNEVNHTKVVYKPSTATQLTAELKNGDTSMTVKSNANWSAFANSRIGFRSSRYISYNNVGTSNSNGGAGMIDSISGNNIVNFKIAYSGDTRAVNTWVFESYAGSGYPYPIQKGQLPTDNTWKYVEGYFGANTLWDGASATGWAGLPADVTQIQLYINIYSNNGTVPIKYSDIRIEPISTGSFNRYENKIQIIGGN